MDRDGKISEVTLGVSGVVPAKCNDGSALWFLPSREEVRNCNFSGSCSPSIHLSTFDIVIKTKTCYVELETREFIRFQTFIYSPTDAPVSCLKKQY